MVKITLPDGSEKCFEKAVTITEVAKSIGSTLAKEALAGKIGDKLFDTSYLIQVDSTLTIITSKTAEGLEIIRHSAAHLLAQAIKHLFPSAQITIGPVIDEGFYYDIAYERTFTPEDLVLIENKMHELAAQGAEVKRIEMSRTEAIEMFKKMGETYKVKIIEDIPADQRLSFYQQGDFIDLCRGPHVPNVNRIKAFKLTKLAGAYWRGDSNNEMLQRIYGTAWQDKAALADYLHRIEEAEKRDHRKLGKQLEWFHFQPEAPGSVFWHPKGWTVYRLVEGYIRKKLQQYDYQEIRTPQILDKVLWEKSGHWEKYADDMFFTESEKHHFAIKPMSCPAHVQVFNQGLKSYRDLPLRLAEFGCCHRNEHSGTLHGLMRVRAFTQDDAHIFCTVDQLQQEIGQLIDLVFEIYHDFGFTDVLSKLSTRPPKRVGADADWDKAEAALEQSLQKKKLAWELCPGDGAFYGPKIDFVLRDSIGRLWQCGTIQVDFQMPHRLDAAYVAEDGSKQTPVMIHRAILGSLERFIGVLIEHYAGRLPLWLTPIQVVVANITDQQANYAQKVAEILQKQGFRVETDLRNEKIGFKIREHTLQKVPYMLVLGNRELEESSLSVRAVNGEDLGTMKIDQFSQLLAGQSDLKSVCVER
jgi:threonyl-tRNA synthetase